MVVIPARERLAELLGRASQSGAFSARRTAPADALHLEVREVGTLQFPVSERQARQLRAVARPARYGLGKRTLTDSRVRDTWEVPRSRVKVDRRRWNTTLLPMLDRLGADLGVPAGCRLSAELHSMLVYEPGQFFLGHQDSEKADDMIGTLVVALPASSRGGQLVIEHAGQRATYRASDRVLTFVAFYADCRHEIRPVTSGHRVVLTYNLRLRGDTLAAASRVRLAPAVVGELAGCLDAHFTQARSATTRLVYLLDHQYTARGLAWARLRGRDAARAAALRAAAQQADCVTALALAETHETWNCPDPDWEDMGRPWRRGRRWYDEPDDDEPEDDEPTGGDPDYQPEELLDWDASLHRWIDESGRPVESVASPVGDDEICATTSSSSLRPHASEYEGYMGNYGNTLDRWYRRAAVVVWPRRNDFAVRAEASPVWALTALSALIEDGDAARARQSAATVALFWDAAVRTAMRSDVPDANHTAVGGDLFTAALQVAGGMADPALAAMLLTPFHVELLAADHARSLIGLAEGYGNKWVRDLLTAWFDPRSPWTYTAAPDRLRWISTLPGLAAALHAVDSGAELAGALLQRSWVWIAEEIDTRRLTGQPSRRDLALAELAEPIAAVLTSTGATGAVDLRDRAISDLRDGGEILLRGLIHVLHAVADVPAGQRAAAGYDTLARHCIRLLEARLAQPERRSDDWSIDAPPGCDCALCQTLAEFLADPARREFDWPLAEPKRRHVHQRIDNPELPVRHQTRRAGRPYTLVLTKMPALFEREAATRRQDQVDLSWLIRRSS